MFADFAWLNPITPLRHRFTQWMDARQPPTDALLLTQRNVYILPTRAGCMFAATLLVLLVASINYQLNLGYMLTFLLAGSAVVSMHITHGGLRGLTLSLKPPSPSFAGEAAMLDVMLNSPTQTRYGIGLKVSAAPAAALAWLDVPAQGGAPVCLSFSPTTRGWHPTPVLTVETRFPFGLFRAWSVWRPAARCLVYPRPEQPAAALPTAQLQPGAGEARHSIQGAELEGVRAYRPGDALQHIAWKKTAQAMNTGSELVSRETRTSAHQQLWLTWQDCATLAPEARLSRLTAWVLAAHNAGIAYGVRLPELEIPVAEGQAHRERCLEALAAWGKP
jgi:uncharacterized protein (DUF58 family)